MSSVTTSLCEATLIEVGPVRFLKAVDTTGPIVFATQKLYVTLHDGNRFALSIHLQEGVTALAAGETVVLPTLDEVPA